MQSITSLVGRKADTPDNKITPSLYIYSAIFAEQGFRYVEFHFHLYELMS